MTEIWHRFEIWMSSYSLNLISSLNDPATEKDILDLENKLAVRLPEHYRNFLKIHNGQRYENNGLIDGELILSTKHIYNEWKVWSELMDSGEFDLYNSEPDIGIKNDWWNKKWIPITSNGSGDHICIDLDPDSKGLSGQIIRTIHDDGRYELLATSFETFLSTYVTDLENGKYSYDMDYNAIVDTTFID